MRMRRIGLLSVCLVALIAGGCGRGKDLGQAKNTEPATVATGGAPNIATQDAKDFIHHVAIVNMAEIELGKLAAQRGQTAEVKKFAQMMIDDHTASGDRLRAVASEVKIEAPTQLDDKHVELRDDLAKRQGADFDREYVSAMVDGHKDLVEQLEPRIDKKTLELWKVQMNGHPTGATETAAILPDPSNNPTTLRINQFAAGIYSTVRMHLDAATTLHRSLKKGSTTP